MLNLHNDQHGMGGEEGLQARQQRVPIHPMEAFTRRHEGIRRHESGLFDPPDDPMEVRMVAVRQLPPLLDHGRRDIHRIHLLHPRDQVAREGTSPTPHIQHTTWGIHDQRRQEIKDHRGIEEARAVGVGNAQVLEG
jgi:hypothetical protein